MVRDKKINNDLAFDFALIASLGEGAKIFGKSAFIRTADFVTTSGMTLPNNAGRGVRDSCSPRNPAGRTFVYIIIAGFFI